MCIKEVRGRRQLPRGNVFHRDTKVSQAASVNPRKRSSVSTRKPEESTPCKYWMSGNCLRGEKCWYLHSWHRGDGFATLAKLEGHKKAVSGIALPSGFDKLYSGSLDGTLRMWDGYTGKCVHLTNLGGEVGSMITEGPLVFIGMKNIVKALNTETEFEFILKGSVGQVFAMTVVRDMLVAGAQNGGITAWRASFETDSFLPAASLEGHVGAVTCFAVGGKTLFSGSVDHTIRGALKLCGMNDAETEPVLFCSCNDNTVRLYELPSFCERGQIFSKRAVRVIERGSGNLFFTGDDSGSLTVWKWQENLKQTH